LKHEGRLENQFFTTDDGSVSIISGRFGERYHSRFGAITECRHISIIHGLGGVLQAMDNVHVLEIGFGTGLNAFLTCIESFQFPQKLISYTGIEGFPLSNIELEKLNYMEVFSQFHTVLDQIQFSDWNSWLQITSNFSMIKIESLFEEFSYPQSHFNLIYYDPFAPGCQPGMWKENMMEKMYFTMASGGVLVTYCAQGAFRRTLRSCGFTVEKLPGPPGKREMTRASKP